MLNKKTYHYRRMRQKEDYRWNDRQTSELWEAGDKQVKNYLLAEYVFWQYLKGFRDIIHTYNKSSARYIWGICTLNFNKDVVYVLTNEEANQNYTTKGIN